MKKLFYFHRSLIICLLSLASSYSATGEATQLSEKCYSAYLLQQDLNMSLTLDESTQMQNVYLAMQIHIRAIETPLRLLTKVAQLGNNTPENIRSYVALLLPEGGEKDRKNSKITARYQHPFMVSVDQVSGELIEIESTSPDKSMIKEYLGYFDLFQYSQNNGSFRYRNGNGYYQARVNKISGTENTIEKSNEGYLNNNQITVKTSKMLMKFEQAKEHSSCFYLSAEGTEVFTNRLAKGSYLRGKTQINLAFNNEIELGNSHYFHTLTNDLSQWPSFNRKVVLTQQQAFERLNTIYRQLQLVEDDKLAFLTLIKEEKAAWPYLADFMTQENSSSKFINRVIWSLNRINSTESVSSLLTVSMSELPDKNIYRSILTLITSSAEINQQGIEDLKLHLTASKNLDNSSDEQLLLLRSLGALAKQRYQNTPLQSQQLKQFLYANVDGASVQFKASLYESIGALGDSIDQQGVELLISGLNEEQSMVKDSALNALSKIPYQKKYSSLYLEQLDSDLKSSTKDKLIELLGEADKDDSLVKEKLLSIVDNSSAHSHKQKSIASLKQIDFEYSDDEIKILESRLKKETDKASQAKLASLILRHRRP